MNHPLPLTTIAVRFLKLGRGSLFQPANLSNHTDVKLAAQLGVKYK